MEGTEDKIHQWVPRNCQHLKTVYIEEWVKTLLDTMSDLFLHIGSDLTLSMQTKACPTRIKHISANMFNTFVLCHSNLIHISFFIDWNVRIS